MTPGVLPHIKLLASNKTPDFIAGATQRRRVDAAPSCGPLGGSLGLAGSDVCLDCFATTRLVVTILFFAPDWQAFATRCSQRLRGVDARLMEAPSIPKWNGGGSASPLE